jgi:hypothetical protein
MCRTVVCLIGLAVVLGLSGGASAGITNDPDLVIHYTFDDFSTVVPDQSGKGHDGTVQVDVTPFVDKARQDHDLNTDGLGRFCNSRFCGVENHSLSDG